jgi:hypothetical protein
MSGAEDERRAAAGQAPRTLDTSLAGLQAGMLGALWMLAWMGMSAAWQRRSFWTAENLMASAFHPNGAIPADFGWSAVTGLALYLLLYSLLGALFAMLPARRPLQPVRIMLLALVFALAWYYFSFHLFWRAVSPAIAFLHPERSTIVGHLIYGLFLGRFYTHYRPEEKPSPEGVTAAETTSDSIAPGA